MYTHTNLKKLILKDTTGFLTERAPFKLYFLSILIGTIGALSSIGYIYSYESLRKWIYLSPVIDLAKISSNTPFWYFFLLFVGGGLLLGLFIYYLIPNHGHGHGMPHLLYRFKHLQYIPVQEGVGATVVSILTLGIGASVGREGPIMFLAAALTSWICKIIGLHGHYYRILICVAVASSLSTSLHSTFVGLFFVFEVLTLSIAAIDILPIALGVFSGIAVRLIIPYILTPVFYTINFSANISHMPAYIVLGILSGLVAIFFIKALSFTISAHQHSSLPEWIWPVFGGIGLAVLMMYVPQSMGIGFDRVPLNASFTDLTFKLILLLFIAKLCSTYLSLGFGFSGGVISPIFVAGMLFGILYCVVLQNFFPFVDANFQIYALIGTAAFTSAVIGAPLTLTMLAYEVSRNVDVTFNTFIAVFFAVLVMRSFKVKSFFQTQYLFLYSD